MLTSALFVALVLTMSFVAAVAVRRSGLTPSSARRAVGLAAVVYLLVPGALAWSGLLDQYTPVPRPMLLVLAVTAVTVVASLSSIGARLATSLGLASLVGFQAFRIPVELLLHRLATEGAIPGVMTYAGWNFDIVTGVLAVLLGVLLVRGRVPVRLLAAWNVLGLLLLANIVTISVLVAPVPFRILSDGPPNTLPSSFPFVWLPTFLVQLALAGHLILIRRLRAEATV